MQNVEYHYDKMDVYKDENNIYGNDQNKLRKWGTMGMKINLK